MHETRTQHERKSLMISGDRLLLALDVLAVLDSRSSNNRIRNYRRLSEDKIKKLVKELFGDHLVYFSPWQVFHTFFHIRLLLCAPHHEPALKETKFNILPVLKTIHSVGDGHRNRWHECDWAFFEAFADGLVSEKDLKD